MKQIKDESVAKLLTLLDEFRRCLDRVLDADLVDERIKEIDAYITELENADPVKTEQEILAELGKTAAEFNRINESLVPYYGEHPEYGFCFECTHIPLRWNAPECKSCKHTQNGDEDNWLPRQQ